MNEFKEPWDGYLMITKISNLKKAIRYIFI